MNMDKNKVSFSLKKKSDKYASNIGNNLFSKDEDDHISSLDNKKDSGKKTQITSFSVSESSKDSIDVENDYVIECKNLLKSTNHSNIEILLNNKEKRSLMDFDNKNTNYTIPIDKFGLAMLKGMGYNPEIHKTKPKIYKKRNYNQSGLGADKEIIDLFEKSSKN